MTITKKSEDRIQNSEEGTAGASDSWLLNSDVSDIDLSLCRAVLYSALAVGFRPPTKEMLDRLVSENKSAALSAAAATIDSGNEGRLGSLLLRLRPQVGSLSDLSSSFFRLFGHTARGTISPYETEYGSEAMFQQPHDLGDLNGFYLAFGLTLKLDEHERPDHISCECEFLSFLALKESYALEKGNLSMSEEARKATRLFLRDHLARFTPAFAKKLRSEDPGGFYDTLGELCVQFVNGECARFDVPAGVETLGLRPAVDDRMPMACGSGVECAAMPGVFNPEAK